VEAVSGNAVGRPGQRLIDRVVAAFLLVVMAVGSLFLWIGMPALALWGASKVTDSPSQHLTLGLLAAPASMILFAPFLVWANALYMRVTGAAAVVEDDQGLRTVRGPLERLLVWSLIFAVVALLVWIVAGGSNGPGAVGPF
jgi:hypothetical protein